MAYIQVQVEGALVRLRVNKDIYEYHSGGRRQPFLCEQPATLVSYKKRADQPGWSAPFLD